MKRRAAILGAVALSAALAIGPAYAQGKKFVYANSSQYDSLDPHTHFDVGRIAIRLNLYDGLYRWHDNPPVLEPWLADGHTVSADGTVYTFKLKPGAKFHDGAEITAEDVVFSAERILAIKKAMYGVLASMLEPGK